MDSGWQPTSGFPVPYSPGYPQPARQMPAHPPVQIGDVQVVGATVMTPVGSFPLAGSRWMVVSQPFPVQKTASWAVVLAVLCAVIGAILALFTCGLSLFMLLGLLFLLAKETTVSGAAMVQVHSADGRLYMAQEAITSQPHVHNLVQRVNYVQALATGGW